MAELLEYKISEGLRAFSTTRQGGVSRGAYSEFNINEYCSDDPADIALNRQSLCAQIGVSNDRLVMPHQVHGTKVVAIDQSLLSLSPSERKEQLEGVDALMTDVPGVCVGVSTADCIPVVIYDTAKKVVAVVHAGWRGTQKRIVEHVIDEMAARYSVSPHTCRAVIGPGISLQNFEVGDEVYEAFRSAGFDMQAIARRFDKWHIDLWEANRLSLTAKGVPAGFIQVAGVCTYARCDLFFSARRLGVQSGRIFTGALIEG